MSEQQWAPDLTRDEHMRFAAIIAVIRDPKSRPVMMRVLSDGRPRVAIGLELEDEGDKTVTVPVALMLDKEASLRLDPGPGVDVVEGVMGPQAPPNS